MQAFRMLAEPTASPLRRIRYTRPWVYAKQEAAIFTDSRFSIVEASTKSGKTVGCILWLLEQAMPLHAGAECWWVAPVYRQAQIAFKRLCRYLPPDTYRKNKTEMTVELLHGVVIRFLSGENPDNLYGEDVHAAVLDEVTRMREEAWHAVRSTLTYTQGKARLIGNVKGRRNWAYKMARQAAMDELPGWEWHRITAQDAIDAGVLSADEVEAAKRELPLAVWKELYEADASDDQNNPFGLEFIARQVRALSAEPPKAFGWDLGKSQDWTVGVGLDKQGQVCRFSRFQRPWDNTTETIIRETGKVPADVDATGLGDPIVEQLQKGRSNFYGFKFTTPSKQQLMEGLALGIQSGGIWFPDGPIKDELEVFEYIPTRTGVLYSAPEGFHDDCVCGLALAWHRFKQISGPQIYV